MNVLFISIFCKRWGPREELGVGYIAALLRQHGHTVISILVPSDSADALMVLNKHLSGYTPELVGISCSHTAININIYRAVSQIVRDKYPSVHLTCGGYFATFNAHKLLEMWPELDSVVIGEGELTVLQVANKLLEGQSVNLIPGLLVKNQKAALPANRIINLDDLPFPVRDIIGLENSSIASISTSRGCLAHCTFCNVPEWTRRYSHGWRGRSAQNVFNEILFLYQNKGVRRFSFVDSSYEDSDEDNFGRIIRIATLIIENRLEISYYVFFRAETVAGSDFKKILPILIKSGLRRIFIGVESGDDKILRSYAKQATIVDNHIALKTIDEAGIHLSIGFIMFNQNSGFDSLTKNLSFLKTTKQLYYTAHLMTRIELYTGSAELTKLMKVKAVGKNSWNCAHGYSFSNPKLEPLAKELVNVRESYKLNYYWEAIHMGYLVSKSALIDNKVNANSLMLRKAARLKFDLDELADTLAHYNEYYFLECLAMAETNWNLRTFNLLTKHYINSIHIEISKTANSLLRKFLLESLNRGIQITY